MTVSRKTDSTMLGLDDIEVLIEAVEAWEHKDVAGELMSSILGAALTDRADPRAAAEFKAEMATRRAEQQRDERKRKDRSILLRAKLIQMADAIRAASFADEAL